MSRDCSRELLLDRKARIEKTITALKREQASLADPLAHQTLIEEQALALEGFETLVEDELVAMDEDFDARKRVIDALDAQITLVVENGNKVAYARCMLGEKFRLQFRSTCATDQLAENSLVLAVRFEIG